MRENNKLRKWCLFARALATKRMVEEEEKMGADAIINIRYASASIMQGAAEVMAYGTAVKFK